MSSLSPSSSQRSMTMGKLLVGISVGEASAFATLLGRKTAVIEGLVSSMGVADAAAKMVGVEATEADAAWSGSTSGIVPAVVGTERKNLSKP